MMALCAGRRRRPRRRDTPWTAFGRCAVTGLFLTVTLHVAPAAAQQTAPYDILIVNGRVLDGTGNPWYRADIAVSGDRIVAVGDLSGATATRVIDANGLYVAPGFIDVHTHAGRGLATPELSHAEPLLAQGITTALLNPDGGGPVDLDRQRDDLLRDGLGVNAALLVPHGSIRRTVLGMDDRAPTPEELARMKDFVRAGMEAGAFGMSSGPYYAPGSFATTEELIELAKVTSPFGGVYTSHIRDEADYSIGVVAAVDEVIRIAREAGVRGVATHLKALGPHVWGFSAALATRIERARADGVEVFADQYPYTASATGLTAALVPRWVQAGGEDSLLQRLATPSVRTRIRAAMVENLARRGGADRIQFRSHDADRSIEGRTLAAVAAERGLEPVDLALRLVEAGGAGIVSFNMSDADVEHLMRQSWMMTSSDGDLVPMDRGVPHPRIYGAFPRKIRVYVVEKGIIDLANAVRSMTTLPATVFRVSDRGALQVGMAADIVVFDVGRVADHATYADPHRLSEGMVYVVVNGQVTVDDTKMTGVRAGQVLRR